MPITISDRDIETVWIHAGRNNDLATSRAAERALDGDESARLEVSRAIWHDRRYCDAVTADRLRAARGLPRDLGSTPLSADTRPRVKYTLPDGRVIRLIIDHDNIPKPMITFELRRDDPLWTMAQRFEGSERRYVLASLAEGL